MTDLDPAAIGHRPDETGRFCASTTCGGSWPCLMHRLTEASETLMQHQASGDYETGYRHGEAAATDAYKKLLAEAERRGAEKALRDASWVIESEVAFKRGLAWHAVVAAARTLRTRADQIAQDRP